MATNPKYKNPPVVETVLGVQFPEIEGFQAVHLGLYWDSLRDRYPDANGQARLDHVQERFPRPPIVPPRAQLLSQPPVSRVCFTARSESELIQLQPDRFHFNWRRTDPSAEYPSYTTNSKKFFEEFDAFQRFCEREKLPLPVPELCEVTYVNHIEPEPGETAIDLACKVFTGLTPEPSGGFLPKPESFAYNRAFVIDDNQDSIGRLYAEAAIAIRSPDHSPRECVLLNMTARVNHDSKKTRSLVESMGLAHDWVVCGFADLTDEHIQEERWEREK